MCIGWLLGRILMVCGYIRGIVIIVISSLFIINRIVYLIWKLIEI